MKAITVQTDKSLAWEEVSPPTPGKNDVLVNVRAAGINRADLAQRAGSYPPPAGASEILGLEVSGEIAELGEEVTGWKKGDRVCALLTGGGYAEQVAVSAPLLMPIPEGWSFEEAGGMPEVFFTAFLNLFMEGGLRAGETALIHGGASGVGTAGIQLAKAAGCRVFTTAGTAKKVEVCSQLGADLAVNYREDDFAERIKEVTNEENGGVDVVLDMVGANYLARNIDLLNLNGRLVFIATLSGKEGEIDIRKLMGKRLTLKGSTLRSRPLEEKKEIKEAFMAQFWSKLEAGEIKPVIHEVFAIQDVEQAHKVMRANKNIGKLILRV